MVALILLVVAFVCFIVGAAWNPPQPRINFTAFGLAMVVLYIMSQVRH